MFNQKQEADLNFLVVAGEGPSLLGLKHFHFKNTTPIQLHDILNKHSKVFGEDLGCIKGAPATIHFNQEHTPPFYKARLAPYSLSDKVEAELPHLTKQGHNLFSQWAAPVVPVLTKDGNIRLCGDYKVNTVAKPNTYPLSRVRTFFISLKW